MDSVSPLAGCLADLLELFQPDRQQRQPLTDVVVQFPRDAGPLGFLRLEQPTAFARAELFGTLALGDVAADGDVVAPVVEGDRFDVELHRKHRSVFSPVDALEQRETGLLAEPCDPLERLVGGIRIHVLHHQRQQFLAAVAQITAGLFVHVEEPLRPGVDDLERIVGAFDQAPEQVERLFTLLAFRDVLDGAAKPDNPAVGVPLRLAARRDPPA